MIRLEGNLKLLEISVMVERQCLIQPKLASDSLRRTLNSKFPCPYLSQELGSKKNIRELKANFAVSRIV